MHEGGERSATFIKMSKLHQPPFDPKLHEFLGEQDDISETQTTSQIQHNSRKSETHIRSLTQIHYRYAKFERLMLVMSKPLTAIESRSSCSYSHGGLASI